MRRHLMPEIREGGVNVTPLIDIVLCLIIFFMLVAKIGVDTGADRNIDIPTSILGTDIKDMGNTLVLNVVNGPTGVPNPQPIVTALVKGQMQELKLRDFYNGKAQDQLLNTLKLYREGDPILKMHAESGFQGRHPRRQIADVPIPCPRADGLQPGPREIVCVRYQATHLMR